MNPLWRKRIIIAAGVLTALAIIILLGSRSFVLSKHTLHLAIGLIPLSWISTFIFVPLWIGTGIRFLAFINGPIIEPVTGIPSEEVYRYFGIFLEFFAYVALFINIICSALLVLGFISDT